MLLVPLSSISQSNTLIRESEMNDTIQLSEMEADLLKEVFNVGIGYAAASLSVLVKQPIMLSVPHLEFCNNAQLIEHLGVDNQLCVVRQRAKGEFSFTSTLLFPQESALNLVRAFAPSFLDESMLVEMLEEGMAEIGNILINACIGKIGEMANARFDLGLPEHQVTDVVEDFVHKLSADADEANILLISVQMVMKEAEYSGDMMFLFDKESLSGFRQHLRGILKAMGVTSVQL